MDRQLEPARETSGVKEERMQVRLGDSMLVVAGGGGISLESDEPSLMACLMEPGAVADILDCQLEVALVLVEGIAERGIKAVFGGGDICLLYTSDAADE